VEPELKDGIAALKKFGNCTIGHHAGVATQALRINEIFNVSAMTSLIG
jgi:hypothetical protein